MMDEKPIVDKVHRYETLVANVLSGGMKICEILQENVLLKISFISSVSEFQWWLEVKKASGFLSTTSFFLQNGNHLAENFAASIKAKSVMAEPPSSDTYTDILHVG